MNEQQIHSVLATCRDKGTELADAEDDQTEKRPKNRPAKFIHGAWLFFGPK
jgi:hypothetical protein